jgi:uncharacterized membrane protein
VTERDPLGRLALTARLERLERELARLGGELAEVRLLLYDAAASTERPLVAEPPAAPPPPAPAPPPPVAPPADVAAARPIMPPLPPLRPPVPPRPAVTAEPSRPTATPAPPGPPRRTFGDLARDWDLTGPRGFAIAGGVVMALGIGFFFVLAANRGWIGPEARVALGGAAAAVVFAGGILLKARYGQYWSALAAVGAGIAGAYATLAAAAARFDLVPDWLALPLAGAIAGVATFVAIRWRSQLIAAIGLLGAALAPALQALDRDLTWESAAFAVLVLVAVAVVTVPRAWRELLVAASVLVGAQVEWLAADPDAAVGGGTVSVTAAFVLILLGVGVARQLAVAGKEVDALALGYSLASFAVALIFAIQMFDDRTDRGVTLLVAAGVWAVVFGAVHRRGLPDLALAIGASALALAAVGTADLLSDAALTIAWAAEALVLAVVARRLSDARTQAMGIAYAALAAVSALVSDGSPELLFDEDADHLAGALPHATTAAAAIGAALLAPATYRARTETGLLAFLAAIRQWLDTHRVGLREALVFAGAALATLAASFALLSLSFEWGHVASSSVAAAVGAAILGVAGRLGSDWLAMSAFVWLSIVLAEALAYDGPTFEVGEDSTGGWSIVAASAGITAGSYALRVLQPERWILDAVCGASIALAFLTGAGIGVVWIDDDRTSIGAGWLVVAIVFAALSAGVFRRDRLRDFSTSLWALAVLALVAAEIALIRDPDARTVFVATTALAVGCLAGPLREVRFWLAGSILIVATTAVSLVSQIKPWLDEVELDRDYAFVAIACALASFALAALRWRDVEWRDPTTVVWANGIGALLAGERLAFGDWPSTLFAAALTAAALALLAEPLAESRLWVAGLLAGCVATAATVAELTPPEHFFSASASPGESLWVLIGCVAALGVTAATVPPPYPRGRLPLVAATGVLALYVVSLGILELAERVSSASVETDFERGHTAVSGLWALLGLGLLVAGLLRRSALLRYGGLALFGLSLAKIFVYDLAELSSVARAFSFIFVGGLLLVGGFFLQRLSDRLARPEPELES